MSRPQLDFRQVAQLPRTYEQTIPEDYLDAMGHMNVMWYTHLFSMASGEVFRLLGLTPQYMQEHTAGMFALEAHIRYLSEVLQGHRISVHSRFLGRTAKRLHMLHFLLNLDKRDVAATFEMVTMHIDMSVRRSSPFPSTIAAAIDESVREHAQIDWPVPLCGVMKA